MTPPEEAVRMAIEQANVSPCRSKRGAAVFDRRNGFVIAAAFNQKPTGFPCDGSLICKATCRHAAVHAEQAAIMRALIRRGGLREQDLLHVKTVDGQLVASGPPSCPQCSKMALWLGMAGVWLFHQDGWRRYDTEEFHRLSIGDPEGPPCSNCGQRGHKARYCHNPNIVGGEY